MGERDLKRLMEKEIKKGSFPLQFDRIELDNETYLMVNSLETLEDIFDYLLRLGEYKCYEKITVINNIYMDYHVLLRQCIMKRIRSIIERIELKGKLLYRVKKLNPDFEGGKVVAESIRCYFKADQKLIDKYEMTKEDIITHGFPMSTKYMLGLYLTCEEARKNITEDIINKIDVKYKDIVRLKNIKDGIFKSLLLDNIHLEGAYYVTDMTSILIIK